MQKKYELEDRTKKFAIAVIKFVSSLEITCVTRVLNHQLLKSGTSIGANYREANRAESTNDFIHKIGIVQKEASETQYWLELLNEDCEISNTRTQPIWDEADELIRIFVTMSQNTKKRRDAK